MAKKKSSLSEKLANVSDKASIDQHPRVVALEKQVAKLLAQQAGGVEADRRVATLKTEASELKAKVKALTDQLAAAEQRNETLVALDASAAARFAKPAPRVRGEATAGIVLSDWHVEETIERDKVSGLNEFNLTIAQRRIERTFNRALMLLEDARHLAKINDLVVFLLGDFISGHIHDDLAESNALAPLPAIMEAKRHIAAGLDFLLAHANADLITVVTANGNHGRTTRKPRASTAAENSFEFNLYLHLQHEYQHEPRLRWQIERGYHNWVTIQGHDFRAHHGDAIRYQGGVGGITIPALKAISQWDRAKRAYCDIFGHWHQSMKLPRFMANGSLIGYSPYSVLIKAEIEAPKQTFFVVDPDHGLTRCLEIFCE